VAPVLFAVPHQDDDVITMGAAISNHVNAGHDVHVVLCTDGVASAAREQTPLSRPEFTRARDREFLAGVTALGVDPANVHISRWSAEDGTLDWVRAHQTILWELVEQLGPDDIYIKGPSWRACTGRHRDHVQLGLAVQRLGEILPQPVRYYVEPNVRTAFQQAHPTVALSTEITGTPGAVLAAVEEYRLVQHGIGRYGIAELSVPHLLAMVEANPVSYRHA
jgi:LmbE family N-acetylglucosaminyl deacetylase